MSEHASHEHTDHHAHMITDFKRRFWISLALSIPVLLLSPLLQQFFGLEGLAFTGQQYVSALLATGIFIYGGKPFLTGLYDEMTQRNPGMMTLISVAVSVAYLYSMAVVFGIPGEVFFWELATLIDVMLLGHWIEMRSVMGASRALDELARLMPAVAHKVIDDQKTEDVAVETLNQSDFVVVKPGEKIPADGVITEGATTVNEAMITGESKPVDKKVDSEVIGGSINHEGSITMKVEKAGDDSYLSQVMDMVQNAQGSQSKTQSLAHRAAFWLTIVALSGGAITFGAWLLFGASFDFALSRTVTVMVITCPHALGLAIPLVVSRSTALTARQGVLIRDRDRFEAIRNINTVVFDKTGTLTKGNFVVSRVHTLGDIEADEVITLAASVESRSEHALATAIVDAASTTKTVKNFQAIPGKGVAGTVENTYVMVVSPAYLEEHGITVDAEKVAELQKRGDTLAYVLAEETPIGVIALGDEIRPESKTAIRQLQRFGITPVMLTGDNAATAQAVAGELGIEEYYAEVLPDQKQDIITRLQRDERRVVMVGDGINDAPALTTADVGIAIGAGTDVAAETADIILVNSDPRDVVRTIRSARKTYRKMKQNLWWASGYNIVAIPLAAGALYGIGIILSPAVGAALMSLSTVVVAINARMLKMP